MQKKTSFLSQKQTDQILKQYICSSKSLDDLIKQKASQNSNLTTTTIIKNLSNRIQSIVLDLQKSLFISNKITQLRIYDHTTQSLFQPILMNLNKIIPQNLNQTFIQLYKNSRLNSIQIIWLTQYNFVYTDQKMQLYNSFIQFLTKQNLFTKIRQEQKDPTQGSIPYEQISRVFPSRDLQLLYKLFKQSNYNVIKTYNKIKELNILGNEYKDKKQFVYRFDNILLIGVYQIYKQIYLQNNGSSRDWQQFKQYRFRHVNFCDHLGMLFRVAIRKDAKPQQIKIIKQIIEKKRFYMSYRQPTENKDHIKQDKLMQKLKKHMEIKNKSNQVNSNKQNERFGQMKI